MNQKWIALIISVLTPPSIISGVASIILWSYFIRLDRLDVFFDVMNIDNILTLVYFASVFSLFLMILAFLSNSIFISLIIPQDINNLPSYNDGIKNLIYILASSPLIMMIIACLLYYISDFYQIINKYAPWIIISIMFITNGAISFLTNRRLLKNDLSYKDDKIKLKKILQIYIFIPSGIGLLMCLQAVPFSIILENIAFRDEEKNTLTIIIMITTLYFFFILTIIPSVYYIRMNGHKSLCKNIGIFTFMFLIILLLSSMIITSLPVMFTHSVITLTGISDFRTHNYIIKTNEYPEEFFSNTIWRKKTIKPEEYYSVQAVSVFTTNKFLFLCPDGIIKSYRESWKFNPLNTAEFDTELRQKLQKEAAYCIPISATAVKRWDIPLQ
ncbi:hypothetical protein [Escherichia marmotae]|uniref:hypothetical protein n=1 Tax=Escherichia marmotae TaxID=1499973 RepID=UPI002F34C6EF